MSDAFLVRRGGSGAMPASRAVLHVTSDAGSTIKFSKGGVIVKVLGPEKQHINSDDPQIADWYFPISPVNYGEWTVTASRGSDSGYKTVTIDSNKQYDVKIRYVLVIFAEDTGLNPAFEVKTNNGTITVASTYIRQVAGDSGYSGFRIEPAIPDIAQYKKVRFTSTSSGFSGTFTVGVSANKTSTGDWAASRTGSGEVNITSITSGDYYIKTHRSNGPSTDTITDIRLLRE